MDKRDSRCGSAFAVTILIPIRYSVEVCDHEFGVGSAAKQLVSDREMVRCALGTGNWIEDIRIRLHVTLCPDQSRDTSSLKLPAVS